MEGRRRTARGTLLSSSSLARPSKHELFGVLVSATSYDEVVALAVDAARRREPMIADFMPVHGLVTAVCQPAFRRRVNRFDIAAPDGQPVRWALNRFHGAGLRDRVYGPELMRRLCRAADEAGIGVYLYGSTPEVIEKLKASLLRQFPSLRIVGAEAPPFRRLTADEDEAVVRRFNESGAGLIFIGLGCPRQEEFAHAHRHSVHAVQLCVGAAFDLLAGTRRMAPPWMQRRGLEWLFRLVQEPGRLCRRYFVTNSVFSFLVVRRLLLGR